MKTALVTTTINVPEVLKLYRACDKDVCFFVTGDLKTPDLQKMIHEDSSWGGNLRYYSPEAQKELGYKCSDLLGWSTIGRRSIAILEALRWGANIIVSWDDDNLPTNLSYFADFERVVGQELSGVKLSGREGWFDPGRLLSPPVMHRGFPHDVSTDYATSFVVGAKVGVAAGLCLADPDVSAVDRMSQHPDVTSVHILGQSGICVDPRQSWTVFNSQNICFTRELAPCFLMVPQFQRFDDILASLIAQRIMRERRQVVHFGRPFIVQERNQHNLVKDLQAELWGMENIKKFASELDALVYLPVDKPVLDQVAHIYHMSWLAEDVRLLGQTWVEDCRGVL